MRQTGLREAAATLTMAALLAACSPGANDTGQAAVESVTTTAEPTNATTSSAKAATSAATTPNTVPTTVTTETPDVTRPSIEVPTSWGNDRDEIFGRYLLYFEAFDAALGPPSADPDDLVTRSVLEDVLKPDAFADAVATIESFQERDIVVVRDEESIDEHILRIPKVQPLGKQEGRKVLIQDCWIRDYDTYTPEGSFIESFGSFRLFNATMEVAGGKWQILANVEQGPDDVGYDWCEEVASQKTE
jgi:hypothetical protein